MEKFARSIDVAERSSKICYSAVGIRRAFLHSTFDLLTYGKDLRTERLLDRKQELRRLLARSPVTSPLKYTEYIDGCGMALFQRVRIGFGRHRCQAEVRALRHRARAKYVVQDSESGIFTEGRQRGFVRT